MSRLIEIREKQAKLVVDARARLDEIADDTPEERARELGAEHDRMMAEYDRLEEQAQRLEKLAERERQINQPDPRRPSGEDGDVDPAGDATLDEQRLAAFQSYLRHGREGMEPEERKLLREMRAQSTADTQGGYTIPQGFMNELVVSMAMYGPMLDPGVTRQISTTSGNQIDWPTMDDTANKAYRLSENATATGADGDLAFGNKQLDAYKYASGPILVPAELMQDSAMNIEQIIRDAMAVRFGRGVNADLTVGDGAGNPNGIVIAAGAGVTAALADGIGFDDLIELFHSIDPAYRGNPSVRWMFHDTTLKLLRKVKDSEGNYIWQPADVRAGAPAVILDKPYVINQDMPGVGAGNDSVLFGAMNKYVVRRVREIAIRRLDERYAEKDQVAFIGFARYDGELMDNAAVKKLTQAAA